MLGFLIRRFIRNPEKVSDPDVREKYGVLSGGMGIVLNLLLFAGKYFAGVLSGSIAVTADAFNNLSDAGSSLVTLFGFRLAGRKPHSDRPFGHGRWEYIAGLIVAALIGVMAFTLGKESFLKILHPEPAEPDLMTSGILAVSVLVKLYMNRYNAFLGKKLDSPAMRAAAADSLSDAGSTLAVLLAMWIGKWSGLRLDGWVGLAVALLILRAGIGAAKDTLGPLLGMPPSRELIDRIGELVLACPVITGLHDLVVHDYGAGRRMISLHAEVPADGDILELHDAIDLVERELNEKLGCHAVIHMDPVVRGDERIERLRREITEVLRTEFGEEIPIHDLRIVPGPTHTNVIFDAVVPQEKQRDPDRVRARIAELVGGLEEGLIPVVTLDVPYTGRGGN